MQRRIDTQSYESSSDAVNSVLEIAESEELNYKTLSKVESQIGLNR